MIKVSAPSGHEEKINRGINKLERWNDGIMGLGILFLLPIIPLFHYSFFSFSACSATSSAKFFIFRGKRKIRIREIFPLEKHPG
jgi:hypothetical protein